MYPFIPLFSLLLFVLKQNAPPPLLSSLRAVKWHYSSFKPFNPILLKYLQAAMQRQLLPHLQTERYMALAGFSSTVTGPMVYPNPSSFTLFTACHIHQIPIETLHLYWPALFWIMPTHTHPRVEDGIVFVLLSGSSLLEASSSGGKQKRDPAGL